MLSLRKNQPLVIPKDEPFKNDALNRSAEVHNLTQIIKSINQPFVLSINGNWGTGKTTFIYLWKEHLEVEGFVTLYFNSWENDNSKNPLIPLIAEIQQQIVTVYKNENLDSIFTDLKNSTGKILAKALPSAIKIASYGILDIKSDSNIEEELAGFFSELPNEYIKLKDEKQKFKKTLTEFANKLGENKILGEDKKIIIFIDELDRCRPTFAVELLENIKHFFDIEKFVFVLALDRTQLGLSLQTLYGNRMDSEGYLRRFIDFNYNLKCQNLNLFVKMLYHNLYYAGIFHNQYLAEMKPQYFVEMITDYCKAFNLSLRDVEQLFFQLKILIPSIEFDYLHNLYTLPLLLTFRMKYVALYDDFINNRSDAKEIIQIINRNKEIQNIYRKYSQDNIEIRITEYLRILSINKPEEYENLQKEYSQKRSEDNPLSHIYSELESIVKLRDRKLLFEIRNLIEYTTNIY